MKRVAIYCRVSGDDRDTEGRNLASQLEMCRQYVSEHNWRIVAELSEDERGVSGATMDAPQLARVFELAAAGEIDVLVVREMDRLARSVAKQLHIEDTLKNHDVEIAYVLGDFDDSPEGQFNKLVRASIAEYERLKITERLVRGRENSVKAGNVMLAARAPFGYRQHQDNGRRTLYIHEVEAEWVRQMYEWYAYGDGKQARVSLRRIADRMTETGVLTVADRNPLYTNKKRPRGMWSATSVRQILVNSVYKGEWTFKTKDGRRIIAPVEPIVGVELWERVQRQFEINRAMSARNTKREYLLRSRIICGQCGYRMHASFQKKKYYYYRCPVSAQTFRAVKCTARTLRSDRLEPRVWAAIVERFADPESLRAYFDEYQRRADHRNAPGRQQLARVDDQILKQTNRLARLMDLHLDGEYSQEIFYAHQAEAERGLERLHRQRERIAATLDAPDTERAARTLLEFAQIVHDDLATLTAYADRRWVVDTLDVLVTAYPDRTATITAHRYPVGVINCD